MNALHAHELASIHVFICTPAHTRSDTLARAHERACSTIHASTLKCRHAITLCVLHVLMPTFDVTEAMLFGEKAFEESNIGNKFYNLKDRGFWAFKACMRNKKDHARTAYDMRFARLPVTHDEHIGEHINANYSPDYPIASTVRLHAAGDYVGNESVISQPFSYFHAQVASSNYELISYTASFKKDSALRYNREPNAMDFSPLHTTAKRRCVRLRVSADPLSAMRIASLSSSAPALQRSRRALSPELATDDCAGHEGPQAHA
eukprot:4313756-Pleurochrysis_carterae.AAC.3